jgi:hypothetical protein
MSEEDSTAIDRSINEPEKLSTQRWVRRGVTILVAIVAALILYKVAASFLPRWWAHRVGDQADGGFTAGTSWGLFYGFSFTFVPLVLLFQVRRRFLNWKAKVAVVFVAVLLAAPNWMTLAVVASNSSAAHAGERTFDVEAPGFRGATLIGVAVGVLMAVLLAGTSMALSHRRRQVKELRAQVRDHERDQSARETPEDQD